MTKTNRRRRVRHPALGPWETPRPSVFTHLICDTCTTSTRKPATGNPDGWVVFPDSDGPGNARCPSCVPDQSRPWSLGPEWMGGGAA